MEWCDPTALESIGNELPQQSWSSRVCSLFTEGLWLQAPLLCCSCFTQSSTRSDQKNSSHSCSSVIRGLAAAPGQRSHTAEFMFTLACRIFRIRLDGGEAVEGGKGGRKKQHLIESQFLGSKWGSVGIESHQLVPGWSVLSRKTPKLARRANVLMTAGLK